MLEERGGFARVSAVVPIVLATVRSATPGFRVGEIGFTPAGSFVYALWLN